MKTEMNFEKLQKADPCEITDEWIFTYLDNPHAINQVKKDRHGAPYALISEGNERSLDFFMQNMQFWKPTIDSHEWTDPRRERGIGLLGWQPVQLEWNLHPRLVERVLAEYGEFVGRIHYGHRNQHALSVEIGRYAGNYVYDDSGSVLVYVNEPRFTFSVYPHAINDQEVSFVDSYYADGTKQTALGIGGLSNFLPTTKATLEFVGAMRSRSGHESTFARELEALQKIMQPHEITA